MIDDDDDACLDPKRFVQTDGAHGLTYEQLEVAMKRVGYNLQGSHKLQKRRVR